MSTPIRNLPGEGERFEDAVSSGAVTLKRPDQEEYLRHARTHSDPTTRFEEMIAQAAVSMEERTDEELLRQGREHSDPARREHALYMYAARHGADALPVLRQALFEDDNTDLRVNLLWSLEWLPSPDCKALALALTKDSVHRVREWARVFSWEMGWAEEDFRKKRPFMHHEGRTFDQTIYLHITCNLYIRLSESNNKWGHILLSPQMLKRVYGQALACNNLSTRDDEVVVAKSLPDLHADGSNHHESFLFRGFTELTNPTQGNFYFETHTPRPIFMSGKAHDTSQGVVDDVTVPFARQGQWFLNENIQVDNRMAIEYVRGLFQGWGYVNLERIENSGGDFFFPGNSILSTLHHPEVGPKTNAYINGRFKGKVVDWDGDEIIDLNYLPAYATTKGELDTNLDGIPDRPGLYVSDYK